jgi:PAS domain S-box-containing protein
MKRHEEDRQESNAAAFDRSVADVEDVLAASPVVLYSAALDGEGMVPLWVSSNVATILGYSVEQALARGWWWRNVHPDDRERAAASGPALRTSREYSHEYRFRHANGAYIWMLDQMKLVVREGSEPTVVGSWTDISVSRRQQERLETAEAHYRRLIRTSPYSICTMDEEGRFTEVNPATERMLGKSDLLMASFTEFVAPHDMEVAAEFYSRIMTGDADSVTRDLRIIRPDGEERLLSIVAAPIREGGAVTGAHSIARDITDEKRIEQQRESERQRYERLVKTSPDAVYALDVEGRFTEVSDATSRLLGRSVSELIGMPFATIIDPEDLPIAAQSFQSKIAGEQETTEIVVRVIRADGERRLVNIRATLIREDGRIIGSHGIGRDITREVTREKQLRRAERLASIGTLVAGVAHELNNPLTAIAGLAELMLLEPQPPEDREMLEVTLREATRAARIVADLRLIARESTDEPRSRSAVDMNDVVEHVLKLQRYSFDTSSIDLEAELTPDLPAVEGTASELEQVVLNLMANARQALERHRGRRVISVRTEFAKGGVALHVSDSGPGIADEHLEHIFDPFFTTKSPGEGMGLGLSLVHRIVGEHGGTVQVESRAGAGATFTIWLPPASGPQSAPSPSVEERKRALRILVVDDEEPIRRAVRRFLERRGHTIEIAADGAEALELIATHTFDVILTDLRMPGMGGEALLDTLRERDPETARRVMFMTGHVARNDEALMQNYAGVTVVEKPFSLVDLEREIEEQAQRTRD